MRRLGFGSDKKDVKKRRRPGGRGYPMPWRGCFRVVERRHECSRQDSKRPETSINGQSTILQTAQTDSALGRSTLISVWLYSCRLDEVRDNMRCEQHDETQNDRACTLEDSVLIALYSFALNNAVRCSKAESSLSRASSLTRQTYRLLFRKDREVLSDALIVHHDQHQHQHQRRHRHHHRP